MEREEGFRYWRVVLIVEQDSYVQDIPFQWDWELLLGCRAELLEHEEVTDRQARAPREDDE